MKKVIGLTGSIASGKSTVSTKLKSLGYQVVDCDEINHKLLLKGNQGYIQVLEEFGCQILASDDQIDRKKLGGLIFNDNAMRLKLNQTKPF